MTHFSALSTFTPNLLAQQTDEGTSPWFVALVIGTIIVFAVFGIIFLIVNFYQKVAQGEAIITNGVGGTKVSFSGLIVVPVLHRAERMDISVKRVEIYRHGSEGLICRDNVRADIKVAFFVRVNKTEQDVLQVAQLLGCARASEQVALVELFDAKFSEGLKTVGKQFDFVELYTSRERFKEELLKSIGRDLNGYILDDAAIDYLEQTPIERLDQDNILDSEGIKKIRDLTSREQIHANEILREKEKVITKQNVEAREAILELERQQAQAEEKQAREIAEIRARERAEAEVVTQQQRQRSELARIAAEEEIAIGEQNKDRQIIVAEKSKQRTDAVETERVEKDRQLEVTERERVVSLATIDKDKAIEVEKKNIQDVIRERVIVERAVVEEEEKIKDTHEFATADRSKRVAVTKAQEEAEQALVKDVQAAEAEKQSASRKAETVVIEAEAQRNAAEKETDARKLLAEAQQAEEAASGFAEAQVMLRKAEAIERDGSAQAHVIREKLTAEAKGEEAKAEATRQTGSAEAEVMELKFNADAAGITKKAEAMKLFDGVGREHEEFKLRLNKEKDVELAAIDIQGKIAREQAEVIGSALGTARIDIVGGETKFFDSIVNSITSGKQVDRLVNNSYVLSDIKQTFFNGDPEDFKTSLGEFVDQFGLKSEDIKNLTIAALLGQMMGQSDDKGILTQLEGMLGYVRSKGISGDKAASFLGSAKKS